MLKTSIFSILLALALMSSIPTTGSWDGPVRLTEPMRFTQPLALGREIKVELEWGQPDGVKSWVVYEDDVALVECFGEPRAIIHHVSPGKRKYYVTAKDSQGRESGPSNIIIIEAD